MPSAKTSLYRVMWELQGRKCFYCSRELQCGHHTKKARPFGWTRDHVVPRSKTAKVAGNIVLACQPCNSSKGCKHPTDEQIAAAQTLWTESMAIHINWTRHRSQQRRLTPTEPRIDLEAYLILIGVSKAQEAA